jgi:hypothetical protein
MALQDKTTLKSYFETGDKPTQAQFEDLIDSLAHVNEAGGGVNIWMDCENSITAADKNKAVMMQTNGKLALYQSTLPTPGQLGVWEVTFNQVVANPFPQAATLSLTIIAPATDTGILQVSANTFNQAFNFVNTVSNSNDIEIGSDAATQATNIANALNNFQTANNYIVFTVAVDTDGVTLLFTSTSYGEFSNSFMISINESVLTGNAQDYSFSGGTNGNQNFVGGPSNSGVVSYYFQSGEWRVQEDPEPADANAEALLFANFINNQNSQYLTAVVSNNVVTITEAQPKGGNLSIYEEAGNNSIQINTIMQPITALGQRSNKPFIGIINEVNETNHKLTVFPHGIVECIAAEPINAIPNLANATTLEHVLYYAGVVPANDGLVRLVNEQMLDELGFNIVGAIGFALSNAIAGQKVIVKQVK